MLISKEKEGVRVGVHTIEELRQFQAMPLPVKVAMTKTRIRAWVQEYGVDGVYVSFSGGKDSTVLLHMVRELYPNIPAVFVDTGLEYPEIREFVKTFDNVTWLKPKMNFRQVIEKYGYPFISKEVSECVYGAKRYLEQVLKDVPPPKDSINTSTIRCAELENIDKLPPRTRGGMTISTENLEALATILNRKLKNREGGSNQRLAMMLGMYTKDKEELIKANIPENEKSRYSQEKYKFFLEAPFEISNKCCNVMKKEPAHRYGRETGRKPILATMADESRLRTQKWLQNGCNGFEMKNPVSTPMSFWMEQDILQYIKENNIEIASVYGDVVYDDGEQLKGQLDFADFNLAREVRKLKTTGCSRTGCCMCGFALHLEKRPNRFEITEMLSNPMISDYILRGGEFDNNGKWTISKEGLGYWFVIKYINIHGGFNIYIPRYEYYESKYGSEKTREYLKEK